MHELVCINGAGCAFNKIIKKCKCPVIDQALDTFKFFEMSFFSYSETNRTLFNQSIALYVKGEDCSFAFFKCTQYLTNVLASPRYKASFFSTASFPL